MSTYRLATNAKATLTDIYVYTFGAWGEAQADKYLDGFYDCFARIINQSELWRPVPAEFGVDGFYTRYEKHLIYWRRSNASEVVVVTILHTSMLQFERLREAFGTVENSDE